MLLFNLMTPVRQATRSSFGANRHGPLFRLMRRRLLGLFAMFSVRVTLNRS